jgi:hypothetical protein
MTALASPATCPLCGLLEPHDENECRDYRRRPAASPLPLIGQKPPVAAGVTTMTTETKALAARAPSPAPVHSVQPMRIESLRDVEYLARACAASGFFKDSRDAAQAVVKIQAGIELGIPPIASMTGVHIIDGKVALSSNLIAAQIKRSGKYDYRVIEWTRERTELAFFQGGTEIGRAAFSMEDARAAGLANKGVWKSYPDAMLFARALSKGARVYTPDVFTGPVYVPEELGAEVDAEGEVISVAASAPKPAARPRAREPAERSQEGGADEAPRPRGQTPSASSKAILKGYCDELDQVQDVGSIAVLQGEWGDRLEKLPARAQRWLEAYEHEVEVRLRGETFRPTEDEELSLEALRGVRET